MTTRHTFSAHAALIPLLHAAKYPHETVIGCLLGPAVVSQAAPTSNDENQEREIRYEHAVPLLHHWTGLSAAIEMAMVLVSRTSRYDPDNCRVNFGQADRTCICHS